jgi:hypothetical protein
LWAPFFGEEVHTFEDIVAKYDFVCAIGIKNGCDRFMYKGNPLGFISELYFGMSNHYGVVVEMDVEKSIVEDYKERFKMVPWITFDVVNNVEFTNA